MKAVLHTIEAVCSRLGVDPYVVGGTVRDRLAGRTSHDWDFVCPKAQGVARSVNQKLVAKLITLDEERKIYRIILPNRITLDFAERQGKTLQQDLARRDFTINAMAMSLTSAVSVEDKAGVKGIIDPFKGQNDLKNKVLRAVSRKALIDDPVRLLRAYRLMAQFDLKAEPRTRSWLAAEHSRLGSRQVARERVREELLRLWSQPHCAEVLQQMDRSGLLTVIFPELEAGRRVGLKYYGKGGVIKHHLQSVAHLEWILENLSTLKFVKTPEILQQMQQYVQEFIGGYPRSAYLKLGALLHDVGKPATAQVLKGRLRFFGHEEVGARMVHKILDTLRFSRQEGMLIRMWVRNHMRAGSLANAPQLTDKAMARFFYDLGEEGVGMVLVSLGDHYTYLARSKWGKGTDAVEQTAERLLTAYYVQRASVLPPRMIDGHQLMKKLRLKPGPLIGKLLEAVRDGQSEGIVKTLDDAMRWARKRLPALAKAARRITSKEARV